MEDKLHFIVIDDSKLDCFIAEKIIQNTGKSDSIKSFMMAEEALNYIRDNHEEEDKTIILVDIQMPIMNGFEFLEAFEKVLQPENRRNYKVHLLSSSINESDKQKAKGFKSVNSFISKPLTPASLNNVLETAE